MTKPIICFLVSKLEMKIVAGIRYVCDLPTQLQPQHFEHEDAFLWARNQWNINNKASKKIPYLILAPETVSKQFYSVLKFVIFF